MSTILHFNYSEVKSQVLQALRKRLGEDVLMSAAEVEGGRIFIKVVSPKLDGLTERKKQDVVWEAMHTLGPNAQAVTLALAFGMDEI